MNKQASTRQIRPSDSNMHICALGSSFAAGPGIKPQIDTTARRSGNNYPSLISRSLNAKLTDLSSSGATLLNVLNEPQQFLLSKSPPQLEGLPRDADIVTLTAGGNDMGYSGGMIMEAAKAEIKDTEVLGGIMEMMGLDEKSSNVTGISSSEVKDRFLKVIDRVHELAPKAKIYLVEYLSVFDSGTVKGPEQPLEHDRVQHYIGMARDLSRAYRDAAAARKEFVEVVPISEVSEGHGVGSREPWMVGFTAKMFLEGGAPFHPNAEGHVAVAREVERRIKGAGGVS